MKIKTVTYLGIHIDVKSFYRINRLFTKNVGGDSVLIIPISYLDQLQRPNEFIRLKFEDYYMDLKLKKFIVNDSTIKLEFSEIIDYNIARYIKPTK
jgi:hypothetical protein